MSSSRKKHCFFSFFMVELKYIGIFRAKKMEHGHSVSAERLIPPPEARISRFDCQKYKLTA